ncbi:hypothetical protein EJ03DRAFT_328221 [Teratosphaeria nubilosa]|uniref:Uncharacterized protein n=1 Tax=Teratosphaeria nubilosa TaxID=161662 RepID=A0A6G1L7N0_9PEZI|nr:hypothetical protein EJ03DRAFT_328221 [Teratosphaeria nubilosa]
MTGYINEWVAENGTKAGIEEQGFAQAYLAWSHKGEKTCNLITSDTCDAPPADGQYQNAQQFYTLYNIFAVYQFFNQFSQALTSSQSLASSKLGQIVDKVAPPVEHVVGTATWYTAFGTALFYTGFVTAPLAFAGPEVAVAAALIVNGLWSARATPPLGYAKKSYTQTAEDRFTALANIGADLADLTAAYLKQVLEEVKTMQDAPEAFIALCSPGGFSQRVTIPLTDQSLNLSSTLEYFVFGEALTASGIVITKSPGIDPRTVPKIDCKELSPKGNCGNFYYHNGNTYSFHDPKFSRDFTPLINFILDEGFVTDLANVFALEDCQGKGPTLDVKPPDWKQTCLMSTKICDYFYDTESEAQRLKQFFNCPNDKKFLTSCGSIFTYNHYTLPLSYLGPQLVKSDFCRN